MKYYALVFTLLLAVMICIPLLNLSNREAATLPASSGAEGAGMDGNVPPSPSAGSVPDADNAQDNASSASAPAAASDSGQDSASGPQPAPAPGENTEQAQGNPGPGSPVPGSSEAGSTVPASDVIPVSKVEPLSELVSLYDKGTGRVIKMTQQEYILGAVLSEMPPSFHEEALKAQAVAAHSYILRCKEQEGKSPDPDLKGAYLEIDTSKRSGYVSEATAREMFGDKFSLYHPAVEKAVRQVENQILIYDGEPIVAAYHSISAGMTESASNVWNGHADYLTPVESPGDRLAPDYETAAAYTVEQAEQCLRTAYAAIKLPDDPAVWFSDLTRSESGYITKAVVGDTEIPGQTLRGIFGLRSSHLSIEYQDGKFLFTATGYGHGVGMSQYGADYMARQGAGYREILAHYYPGSTLVRIAP